MLATKINVTYNGSNIIDDLDISNNDLRIIYDETIIATLSATGNKTLKCKDKVMKSDVILSDGIVTKTLKCRRKIMSSDVIVSMNRFEQWDTPTIQLSNSTVSTDVVEGVTKYAVYDNGTYLGYIDSSNTWHPKMPTKGQIITIENKRYRVLDIQGSNAKLYGLFDIGLTNFAERYDNNTYAGSTLDILLNTTWFGQQSEAFKTAVIDSSIVTNTYQNNYSEPATWDYKCELEWDETDLRYFVLKASTEAITRKVYALDIKDYFDYLGKNSSTSKELMQFFFEGNGEQGQYSNIEHWVRSARHNTTDAFTVNGSAGTFGFDTTHYPEPYINVRPAFSIDLSKINWS